jgi:hypothetical protein
MNKPLPDNSVYPLRTLRDIFELPTHEHMERCLDELKKVMLTSRATADLMMAFAKKEGANTALAKIQWPEVMEWKDDGLGELGCDIKSPNNETILSTRIKKKDDGSNKAN